MPEKLKPYASPISREITRWDKRNQAGTVHFNLIKQYPNIYNHRFGDYYLLAGKNKQRAVTYEITENEFAILNMICVYGFGLTRLNEFFSVAQDTMKNELSDLFRKFKVKNERNENGELKLLSKLIKQGVVDYKPGIK